MKKFNFKLQRILDIREKLELEQKNVLVKVASEYQQLIMQKQNILQKINEDRQKIYNNITTTNISIQHLKYMDFLQNQADSFIFSLEPKILEIQKKMEKERDRYNKLVKERKSIEILKNNEMKKYHLYQKKIEATFMDEIANKRSD